MSARTSFGRRWIEQLLALYNAEGPDALGDLHCPNGALARFLKTGLPANGFLNIERSSQRDIEGRAPATRPRLSATLMKLPVAGGRREEILVLDECSDGASSNLCGQ